MTDGLFYCLYGKIYIIPGIEEMTNPDIYTENIEVDGVKGVIGFPSETNSLYKVVIGDTFISSGLPFYETADLLRTLHIRPLNKNAS